MTGNNKQKYTIDKLLRIRMISIVLPVNIIVLITTILLFAAVVSNITEREKRVLSMDMRSIDEEIHEAEYLLLDLMSGNTYIEATRVGINSDDLYSMLRAQVQISDQFQKWLIRQQMVGGYFLFLPESSQCIIRTKNSDDSWVWIDLLKNQTDMLTSKNGWHVYTHPQGKNYLYLISSKGESLYGAWIDIENAFSYLGLLPQNQEHDNSEYGLMELTSEETDKYWFYTLSARTELMLYREGGMWEVLGLIPAVLVVLAVLSFVTLLALPFLWHTLKKQVINPLNMLLEGVEKIRNGDTDFRIVCHDSASEFEWLNRHFNTAVDTVDAYRKNMYEAQIEEQRIRIRYLTQQIQPHFMLNALNFLYCCDEEQHEMMQEIIVCLSDYFRYVMGARSNFVLLKKEITHIRNYLKLQKMRYPDCLDVHIYVEENLNNSLIPPMIIQQLVENTMKYGFSHEKGKKLLIDINVIVAAPGMLNITVWDTGQGFAPEVLEKIQSMIHTKKPDETMGIGICNIIERLLLLYNENADIKILNRPGGGAEIRMNIPLMYGEDEEDFLMYQDNIEGDSI